MHAPTSARKASPGLLSGPGIRIAVLVSLAHALNDAYAAFLHPLLPRIMDRLGLSIALAATLATAFSVASSLVQPVAGYLADRFGRRLLVALGPVISGVFLSLMGWAPSFEILMGLLVVGGLGSALFHPPGASYAAGGVARRVVGYASRSFPWAEPPGSRSGPWPPWQWWGG
jgi:FSR family fosmidomycin resistance protein-like MFS transporter